MEQYTIYCTPDQTRKALVLGAPIEMFGSEDASSAMVNFAMQENQVPDLEELLNQEDHATVIGSYAYCIPTAEQMNGWLEKQGISARGNCFSWADDHHKPSWQVHVFDKENDFWFEKMYGFSNSRKEATIAAIDAALEYLYKNKEIA